jgi:4'-phosphopantetheinyl transferase
MEFTFHQFKVDSSEINLLEFSDEFKAENYLDTLSELEIERYFSFKHDKRRKEFVATRILKHQLFNYQEIKYKDHGAPFVNDSTYISISHGPNLVGIASNDFYPIGFDIEKINVKTKLIFQKYLTIEEQKFIDISNEIELTECWSFKETMYKLAGRKKIDFKKDLVLLEYSKNQAKAKICNSYEEIFVNLHSFQFKDFIITINSNAAEFSEKY